MPNLPSYPTTNPYTGTVPGGVSSMSRPSTGSSIGSGAGTGAAIGTSIMPGYGTLIGAAAGAIGGYFSSKHEADAQEQSARLQSEAATRAAQMQQQANEEALNFQRQQSAQDQTNFENTQHRNYDQYLAHYNAARQLGQQMGFNLPEAQPFDLGGKVVNRGGAQGGSQFSGEDAALGEMLRSGMDPAQAISQFNQRYGRTTGNEATFAHDNTIAVPSGYFANGANGWQFAGGDHSGGSAGPSGTRTSLSPSTIASYLYGQSGDPSLVLPLQQPSIFGSRAVGSYLR